MFPQKCALFLEYRLVGMRLLHVHQLFDPVLERTNQTHPYVMTKNIRAINSLKLVCTGSRVKMRICSLYMGRSRLRLILPRVRLCTLDITYSHVQRALHH